MWWKLTGLGVVAAAIIAVLLMPIPGMEMTVTLPPPGRVAPVEISPLDPWQIALMAAVPILLIALVIVVWLMVRIVRRGRRARISTL